jgi:hypothetical protein
MKFVDNVAWSVDSRYVQFNGLDEVNHPWLLRLTIPQGKLERIADLAKFTRASENWYGVALNGEPLAFQGVAAHEIYALKCILP